MKKMESSRNVGLPKEKNQGFHMLPNEIPKGRVEAFAEIETGGSISRLIARLERNIYILNRRGQDANALLLGSKIIHIHEDEESDMYGSFSILMQSQLHTSPQLTLLFPRMGKTTETTNTKNARTGIVNRSGM